MPTQPENQVMDPNTMDSNTINPNSMDSNISSPVPSQLAQPATQSMPQAAAQPVNPPAENPLDKLRDIHLPAEVDQFPIAPGWWILLGVVLLLIAFFIYRSLKRRRALKFLKPTLAEVESLSNINSPVAKDVAELAAIIKRVALFYFPANLVASQIGMVWYSALNKIESKPFFSAMVIDLLVNHAYQKSPQVDPTLWQKACGETKKFATSIMRSAADNKHNRLPDQLVERIQLDIQPRSAIHGAAK